MLNLGTSRAAVLALGLFSVASLWPMATRAGDAHIEGLSSGSARPGTSVTIVGHGFDATPGAVVVTGLRVAPAAWSDTSITLVLPEDGASGFVAVRTAGGLLSNKVPFTVDRPLPAGQFAPHGLALEDTGLLGSAFLAETDGAFLYGVCGFETLSTHELRDSQPHALRSRIYLNQRVGDIRLHGGYLFCAGDHGLLVYRCSDLQANAPVVVAAVAGGSYLAVDVRSDPQGALAGALVGLCEHLPRAGTNTLRVVFYQFAGEALTRLGTFARTVGPDERQHAIALDPLNRKAYVSGWESLIGTNKYILELSTTNLAAPTLQHREKTGVVLAGDMDALGNVLWAGVTTTAATTELFRAYALNGGTAHLSLSRVVNGGFSLGRVARVKVVDSQVTVGCSWYGNRPDIFLLTTFGSTTTPSAWRNSLDWAFDVTGFARPSGTNAGKVIVADEWGGFLTLDYQVTPKFGLTHRPDYQWVVGAAMTEGLHLTADRIYVAGRGAGPWSADRFDLANSSKWKRVEFDWAQAEPQPHPISAVCTRDDPRGRLIAALGHDKAMNWGTKVLALLYRETATNIELLAVSEELDPPGLGSRGVSAVWPEPDLVFMTTGSDGFRACVVNPDAPSITFHRDCRESGFDTNTFNTANMAQCMKHFTDGANRYLIVGSVPGLLVSAPTLHVYALSYPQGIPDRLHADAAINVVQTAALKCLAFKAVYNLDVRPSGLLALATSQGLAVLHPAWIAALNELTDFQAWNKIRVPVDAFSPWHDAAWPAAVSDVSFADDGALYAVKAPSGVWRIAVELDAANHTHRSLATAFYPGVETGMDYTTMLHGWANPDIVTLHHPYGVIADGPTAYVTGWSGKVQRLTWQPDSGVHLTTLSRSASRIDLAFTSPFGARTYRVETTTDLNGSPWTTISGAVIRPTGDGAFAAQCPPSAAARQFYRIGVRQ
ncbi:MAG: hypothetical protein HYY24_01565 [Verrucomicrobia bacterium]|nr:hypothetical protein [Verrucomicrobiota bacterium]